MEIFELSITVMELSRKLFYSEFPSPQIPTVKEFT
jgi:hypothetical protein